MTIKVTFPDGAVRDYARGTTGTTVVEGISTSLAKKTVAMKWNGALADLSNPLEGDGRIEFVMRDSADGLGLIRHDAAHVLRPTRPVAPLPVPQADELDARAAVVVQLHL